MFTVNPLINAPLLFNVPSNKGNKEKTNDLKNSLESDIEDANVCFNPLDEDAEDVDFVDVVYLTHKIERIFSYCEKLHITICNGFLTEETYDQH